MNAIACSIWLLSASLCLAVSVSSSGDHSCLAPTTSACSASPEDRALHVPCLSVAPVNAREFKLITKGNVVRGANSTDAMMRIVVRCRGGIVLGLAAGPVCSPFTQEVCYPGHSGAPGCMVIESSGLPCILHENQTAVHTTSVYMPNAKAAEECEVHVSAHTDSSDDPSTRLLLLCIAAFIQFV